MKPFLFLSSVIDRITTAVGHAVSWLILGAVLVSAGNAIIRKLFDISSNAWLEAQWYMFSAVFLLAAAYALKNNNHVRIDVVFGSLSKTAQNWITLFGHVFFLMPFSLLMIYETAPVVLRTFLQNEYSSSAGGLIIWPGKALILGGFVLLAFQGISEIIKRIAVMRGLIPDPWEEGHGSSAEAQPSEHKP